jgi:hypothetical protein
MLQRITYWLILLAVMAAAPTLLRADETKPDKRAATPADTHISISGGLSSSEIRNGNSALFWVTIENNSDSTLDSVQLQLDLDKNEFAVTCPQFPQEQTLGTDEPACGPLKKPLLPNQAITLRGQVQSLKTTESRNINALVSFKELRPGQTNSVFSVRAITLGQLTSHSWFVQFFTTYKELLLPLVLLILGWSLSRRQEKVQRRRAEVAETWNSMLPVSHKLTLKYYMPMVKSLLRVAEDNKLISFDPKLDHAIARDTMSVYFHTMQFWWHFRRTVDGKAAIYFKNRTGEKIVLLSFAEFRSHYKGTGPERFDIEQRLYGITERFTAEVDFPKLWTAFNTNPRTEFAAAFETGWKDFSEWYFDSSKRIRSLALLDLFRLILEFEANRPYQKWYNSQEALSLTEGQEETLMSLAGDDLGSKEEFRAYLKQAKNGRLD